VQLLKEGNSAETVARMYDVSRAMLFRWQQKYDQDGPAALGTKKTPGPASRLSLTQISQLYAIITGSDPRQMQFDFGLWTRKIIRDLIRRQFGVKLSEVQEAYAKPWLLQPVPPVSGILVRLATRRMK